MSSKLLATIIDKEENFSLRLYVFVAIEIHKVQIFEEVSAEVVLVPRLIVPAKAQFFFGIIAPTLLMFSLVSGEGVTAYNRQRVMRQFGYNQGCRHSVRRVVHIECLSG